MVYISDMKASCGEWQREYLYKLFMLTWPLGLSQASNVQQAKDKFGSVIDLYNARTFWGDRETSNIEIAWGGEKVEYSGVDGSSHQGELEFYDDEAQVVRTVLNALKDLTGDQEHQTASEKLDSVFNLAVARVNVKKNKITSYMKFEDSQVFKVTESNPDRAGTKENRLTAMIRFDRPLRDDSFIGKAI